MQIVDGILVVRSALQYVSSNTGMQRYIDRLSGKRRHVRRSSGPGGGVRIAEETQEREINDSEYEVGGIELEKISSPAATSEVCCDDKSLTNIYYSSSPHLHHLHRHRSHHHLSSRRRYRRDTDDGRNSNDVCDDDVNENNDDNNDSETCLERFHPCLRQRLYDGRSCRSSSDVNARVDIDHVEIHRTETTTVHPLVRTSPATATNTATTITNPSIATAITRGCKIPPYFALLLLSYTFLGVAEACSSRSTPKPRPPTSTDRPNITFHMYTCPPDYAEWYCLNGATCFTVKIVDSLLYNCLCANGYIGQRCEFKDLDGSYIHSRQQVLLETASIAGGATIAVFLVVIICIAVYIHFKRKQKELRSSSNCVDTVDGPGRDSAELRPFSNRSRSLMIFMAKNPNSSATIEQTRMPTWNCPEAESMKTDASISESKHFSQ
ncbi:uncharacterized protein LOC109855760 [Pseudomyrmex gracilis]|uniref:uncharacterized protein LOC109855760 n=1 Tax=Pseudomyrmex gracilis TaxID=219809 RepID=UPI0009951457|nr:uncharacterized protein LOC109855760 [Pseudomyrmex gracilis]